MKSLFIGNSHVVALKDGLDLAPSRLGNSPTFLIAPGSELDVEITAGRIVPKAARTQIVSPEGESIRALDIASFDVFVIAGLGVSPGQCARLLRKYGLWSEKDSGGRLLSRAVFAATVRGLLRETPAFSLAAGLRKETDAPILVVAQPMPPARVRFAELVTERHKELFERWKPLFAPDACDRLYATFRSSADEVARELRVQFIEQAPESRAQSLSKDEYQARVRVNFFRRVPDRENEIEDFSHLNGAYGALMIRAIERAILG